MSSERRSRGGAHEAAPQRIGLRTMTGRLTNQKRDLYAFVMKERYATAACSSSVRSSVGLRRVLRSLNTRTKSIEGAVGLVGEGSGEWAR